MIVVSMGLLTVSVAVLVGEGSIDVDMEMVDEATYDDEGVGLVWLGWLVEDKTDDVVSGNKYLLPIWSNIFKLFA